VLLLFRLLRVASTLRVLRTLGLNDCVTELTFNRVLVTCVKCLSNCLLSVVQVAFLLVMTVITAAHGFVLSLLHSALVMSAVIRAK